MTDHDEAVPDRKLDLGALADGVRPSPAQWEAISATAAHRRRRRTWVLSAAAALVIVATTATVLLTRSDGDGGFDLATGDAGGPTYVIPPEDATEVSLLRTSPSYAVAYRTEDLHWSLHGVAEEELRSASQLPVEELLAAAEDAGIERTRIAGFDAVYLGCGGAFSSAFAPQGPAPDTTMVFDPETGPLMAAWSSGGRLMTLVIASDTDCRSLEGRSSLTDAIEELRVIDADEFERWRTSFDSGPATSVIPATSLPAEDPPADEAAARAEITALVQDYTVPAADGTYPKLEDGVTRADEYRDIFVLMRKRVGTEPDAEPAPNIVTLTSIRFTSPTDAVVVWDNEVTLPGTNTAHFSQSGRALLQDGRWVMSWDTIQNILQRACVPPGGRDPSCQNGGSAQSGTGSQGDDSAQIEAAIQGFDTRAADGTFPYLEDGVARAESYAARQAAGSAAVGRTAEDKAGQVHTITSLTIAGADEADVRFTIAVTLRGQRNTYQHSARMIRQDGRWVMDRQSWFVISSVACGDESYRSAYPDDCR